MDKLMPIEVSNCRSGRGKAAVSLRVAVLASVAAKSSEETFSGRLFRLDSELEQARSDVGRRESR